jgi:hypothetical protein
MVTYFDIRFQDGFIYLRKGSVAGLIKHGNEHSGFIKGCIRFSERSQLHRLIDSFHNYVHVNYVTTPVGLDDNHPGFCNNSWARVFVFEVPVISHIQWFAAK